MKVSLNKNVKVQSTIRCVSDRAAAKIADFDGQKKQVTVRYDENGATILCGVGPREHVDIHAIRDAASRGMTTALGLKHQAVALTEFSETGEVRPHAVAALEGAVLAAYSFDKYKSEKPARLKKLDFLGPSLRKSDVMLVQALCDGVNTARELINDNAEVVTPEYLAKQAKALARASDMELEILTEKEIEKKGLGLLHAVGKGSPFPPRLIIMSYTGKPSRKKTTAIIGKGITFDSGGQNLKTSGHIETMRCDMGGAATVLGVMKTVAELKPKINVLGVIASAHNAIGSRTYFPGDIYTSYKGTTVEITNTDAEGRLVLADAFAYTQEQYHPSRMIDLATLTGGVVVALGDTICGLFSNDDALADELLASSQQTGEALWRLPVYQEHSEAMKSDLADLRNTARLKRGHASSITGAAFLKEFVVGIPWAHLDIAGVAFNEREPRGVYPKYATGFGVRLLYNFLTTQR
ncbi:MAG: aminopeptidase [Chitinivibrionales bacterium]|nr:aminopeptidase [Chitinivibrionales bacterium]